MLPALGGSVNRVSGIVWLFRVRTPIQLPSKARHTTARSHTHVESVLICVLLKDGKGLLVGAGIEAVRLASGLLGRVGARNDGLEELDETVTLALIGGEAVCVYVSKSDVYSPGEPVEAGPRPGSGRG